MIETVINLRDHEVWPKRKLRFDDAVAQTRVVLDALEAQGPAPPPGLGRGAGGAGQRGGDDRRRAGSMRCSATWRCGGWRSSGPELGRALVGEAVDALLGPRRARRRRPQADADRARGPGRVAGEDLRRPARRPGPARRRDRAGRTTPRKRLIALGVLRDRPDLLAPPRAAPGAGRRGRRRRAGLRQADPVHPDRRRPRRRATSTGSRSGSSRSTGSCSTAPSAPPTGRRSRS